MTIQKDGNNTAADVLTRYSSLHQGNEAKHKAIMIFVYSAISPWTNCHLSSGCQAFVSPSLYAGVQKGEDAFLLQLHSELNGGCNAVEMVQQSIHSPQLHYATNVIHIPLPECGTLWSGLQCQLFEMLHTYVCYHCWDWGLHCSSFALLIELTLKTEIDRPQAQL